MIVMVVLDNCFMTRHSLTLPRTWTPAPPVATHASFPLIQNIHSYCFDFENKTINLCRSRLGFQVGLSGQMVTVDIYLLPIVRRPRDTAVAGR